MSIDLPANEATAHLSPAEARSELARTLYSWGVGRAAGSELTGVDFLAFQLTPTEWGTSTVTVQMPCADLDALKSLFPQ
jgi:hypothetical protein